MPEHRHTVMRVTSRPEKDELVTEFRAVINGYQIQPRTGALNLALLVAFEYLQDDVMDLGRHTGMELVVQVYRPKSRPSVLGMAQMDEDGEEEEADEDEKGTVEFIQSLQGEGQ